MLVTEKPCCSMISQHIEDGKTKKMPKRVFRTHKSKLKEQPESGVVSHLLESEREKGGQTGRAWSEGVLVSEDGDILGETETILSREVIEDSEVEDGTKIETKRHELLSILLRKW